MLCPGHTRFTPRIDSIVSCVYALSHFSPVQLCATPKTVATQAPLSLEFSRQEYWNEFSFPSPGDVSDPGIKLSSPILQANSSLSEALYFQKWVAMEKWNLWVVFIVNWSYIGVTSNLGFPLVGHIQQIAPKNQQLRLIEYSLFFWFQFSSVQSLSCV